MSFTSSAFAIFLPIVFLLYWFAFGVGMRWCKRQLLLQNLFLLAVSYVFYGWWNWRLLLLIALTSFSSWATAIGIEKGSNARIRKTWLTFNIVLNLGILGLFKYYDFFVNSFCNAFGIDSSPYLLHLLLPVGISFYTFQALSYSIDVWRGKIRATRDVVAFFAYIAFFPQLVAGPIERATHLLPQFFRERTFQYAEAIEGMKRILFGLFKKIVIADNCAWYVDGCWSDISHQNGATLMLAAVLFSLQIYCDFSGYSDIAIGTARLFGFNLRENFLTPYFSRNVAEFWKRWHISLNTWFVDYVYIPLGGSREGRVRTICNTFVIFLLSGLWHGANWTYVTWGLYHALLFVPLIGLGLTKRYKGNAQWKDVPAILLTFALVTLGWVLFRAPSIADAGVFLAHAIAHIAEGAPAWPEPARMNQLLLAIILLTILDWGNRSKAHALSTLPRSRVFRWAFYFVLIFWCQYSTYAYSTGSHPFIYFQF